MRKINTEEIKNIIKNTPKNINLLFIGDTGIGKTQIINEYAAMNNIYIETLILSQLDPSDCLGIPIKEDIKINNENITCIGTAIPKWAYNFYLKIKEGKECILFLDEFLCAQPSVQNSFLNFLIMKKINNIDLSELRIIAATNIGNYTFKPDKNMMNRFCFIQVINNKKLFKKYIEEKYDKVNYSLINAVEENDYSSLYEDNIIFEERNLSPRQAESLMQIEDINLLKILYEGYTNKSYEDIEIIEYTKNNLFNIALKRQLDILKSVMIDRKIGTNYKFDYNNIEKDEINIIIKLLYTQNIINNNNKNDILNDIKLKIDNNKKMCKFINILYDCIKENNNTKNLYVNSIDINQSNKELDYIKLYLNEKIKIVLNDNSTMLGVVSNIIKDDKNNVLFDIIDNDLSYTNIYVHDIKSIEPV